ncbi:UbiA family prenyltransferase [Frankia sp. AiPa1]|uniref:UbiA family prenyltransferase n=1 Tax=Frankia sp. AiPa1 TaxID=573492 RepID=UPI00202AFBFD|nr:UbiA family prenyltransferase [Frankia sp. AiPa1]MCL9758670.1 UbiA family prenyltransferase [Frankia sp. AiPa1]
MPGRCAALVRACHPEPTAAVTLFSVALAASSGRTAGGVGLVASAVLAGQLSVGWSNDLVDRHRDAAGGRAGKPLVGEGLTPATVAAATAMALVACVPLSLACGERAGFTHLAAVASAWGYNLGLKSTSLSVVPYAVSFALLPTFVVQGLPGAPAPPWWLPAAGALLGAGAHFANVLPDLDADARTGVRGLPQRLGATGSRGSAALLLAAGSAVAALGPARPSRWRVGVLAAVGVLTGVGLRRDDRTAFRTAMAVAAIDVALVVAGTWLG